MKISSICLYLVAGALARPVDYVPTESDDLDRIGHKPYPDISVKSTCPRPPLKYTRVKLRSEYPDTQGA